jgi:U3 small nucleolar RNA-associated protein 14
MRSGRAPTSSTVKPRTAKSNAAGYAARQARRGAAPSAAALADVYEHQQARSKHTRSGVDTHVGRDELDDLDARGGDEDADAGALGLGGKNARLVGENEEEAIGSDDDEEIDSDAAFEEEDDDRYAGFDFPSAAKVRCPLLNAACDAHVRAEGQGKAESQVCEEARYAGSEYTVRGDRPERG